MKSFYGSGISFVTLASLLGCGPEAPDGQIQETTGGSGDTLTSTSTPLPGTSGSDTTSTGESAADSSADSSADGGTTASTDTPERLECVNNYPALRNCETAWDAASDCIHCNLYFDDCAPGSKCEVLGGDTCTDCVAIADDPDQLFEPCDDARGIDTCDKGMNCEFGICLLHCQCSPEYPHCPEMSDSCYVANDYFQQYFCIPRCSPVQDDCPPPLTCQLFGDHNWLCFGGGGPQIQQIHEPCGAAARCESGLDCVESGLVPSCDPGESACCTEICDVENAAPCPNSPPEVECIPYDDADDIEQCVPGLGRCIVPPS